MSATSPPVSTWAPLRNGVFRALWLAVLISNVAIWMQTVGAQWLLVSQPHAPILVALVQTADYLPDFAFGLVGGVLADTFDRRRLLMAVQGFLVVVGAALAALTIAGLMPPALLPTSWDEHMKQHLDRLTRTDQQYEEEAGAFSVAPVGDVAPQRGRPYRTRANFSAGPPSPLKGRGQGEGRERNFYWQVKEQNECL
jgi:hypothetical protein